MCVVAQTSTMTLQQMPKKLFHKLESKKIEQFITKAITAVIQVQITLKTTRAVNLDGVRW